MLETLFDQAGIPPGRALLVHARLRGLHQRTGANYQVLADDLLRCLLACRPSLLLIPAFTKYSFIAMRIFHLDYAHSEVGRFSEEMRRRGYPRTPDPMYSMLDVLGTLPPGLNYLQTFGPGTLVDYLLKQDGIVVNVDMPFFYATPVHHVELEHGVPYWFNTVYTGHIQATDGLWTKISYNAYVRKVSSYGTGAYPAYNQKRRLVYLRQEGVLTESRTDIGQLAWAPLSSFCSAISAALSKSTCFLIDQPSR